MQGNKYQAALAQITTSLGSSETSMAFAQMSVKLMNQGTHQRSDVVGMVVAQVSLKAAIKKWGKEAMSLLYYKKFVKSLKSKGFKLNPYDPCVANKHGNALFAVHPNMRSHISGGLTMGR